MNDFLKVEIKNGWGIITLNNPKGLNALNLEMIRGMRKVLREWEKEPAVKAVLFDSEGDRAFCAGGDVVSLYKWMCEGNGEASQFFKEEYDLDFAIHCYPKPTIVFADKIVMGGGIGIMNGCRHRIVTERTLMAMPEITIGLFPDVGGSYFLNQMPGKLGLFLGLTGARFNGPDAIYLQMADDFVESQYLAELKDSLLHCEGGQEIEAAIEVFAEKSKTAMPAEQWESRQEVIDKLMNAVDVIDLDHKLRKFQTEDGLINRALAIYAKGSPLSTAVIYEQIIIGEDLELSDVFDRELKMATRFCQDSDFKEGVRALLIDKDNSPNWKYKTIGAVPASVVDSFFKE